MQTDFKEPAERKVKPTPKPVEKKLSTNSELDRATERLESMAKGNQDTMQQLQEAKNAVFNNYQRKKQEVFPPPQKRKPVVILAKS